MALKPTVYEAASPSCPHRIHTIVYFGLVLFVLSLLITVFLGEVPFKPACPGSA